MDIAPINEDDGSLTERAYQAISGAITRLELKPGEMLTQDRLAKWLSISRTPVREALRRLEQDGVIQHVSGRGLIVAELTVQDVEELLELLQVLDTHAALLAARRRDGEQATALVAIANTLLDAAEQRDLERWSIRDKPYHETLLNATQNMRLKYSVLNVRKRLQRITYNVAVDPEFLMLGTHEHVAIARAIAAGDERAASEAMRLHLESVAGRAMLLVRNYLVPIRGERF